MRKLILLLTASLALAACNSGSGLAATVNGIDITVAEVQAMRITDSATIDKAAFASDLTAAIIGRAVVKAAKDEFSIVASPAEVDAMVADLTGQIETNSGVSVEEVFASRGLPIERLREIASQEVVRQKLYDHFVSDAVPATDADAATLISEEPTRVSACLSHILVATEQEAVDARARIEAGEDFAAVAAAVGTDGTAAQGGSLGCAPLSDYVAEFAQAAADAAVGVVSPPVQSQFGWHLILVESKEQPALDEIKDEITAARINQLLNDWVVNVLETATVSVESRYGTWVTDPQAMVVAPVS